MARASGGRKSRLAERRHAQIVRQINTAIGGLAVTNRVLRPIYGRHPFRLALLIIHFLEPIGLGSNCRNCLLLVALARQRGEPGTRQAAQYHR